MICWHYTKHLPEDGILIPDYSGNRKRAVPYLEILRRSDRLMVRHLEAERERLRGMKSAGSDDDSLNPDKWAAEAVFEAVRQSLKEIPSVSRLRCVFLWKEKETALRRLLEDSRGSDEEMHLFRVDTKDAVLFTHDSRMFDGAYKAIEDNDPAKAAEFARAYWTNHRCPAQYEELLCGSSVRVIEEVRY